MTPKSAYDAGAGPGFTPGEVTVHEQPAELAKVTRALRGTGRKITLVPTMGSLHEGHRELIRRARRVSGGVTVVSNFVNPLQFGPDEDFERYPRSWESDVEACRQEGAELVFAPSTEALYGPDPQITVNPGPLGDQLEGASRPGHFAGVLTVVAKLFGIMRPDLALFGEKDYQQLVLLRRMAHELHLGTAVQGIPVVRESDGLALSSRNAYLASEQRGAALALSAALAAGAHAGASGADAVLEAARGVLETEPLLELDYLELRDTELGPAPAEGEARLLVAATVGGTRLIDNALVLLGSSGAPE
ncbi:pantoate--beta-alanine ligase [Saccharopolyspora lacisalsi]|uniref:Pantothenate synthetase n=1 Tax=Halosaccharopolyspora lacisalsi TaxID=1000566 RepID=A0A839DX79_9PSEU|nr:pantoate--beta-alanine ligase [Halosaccharopolyspora lacisalsi]MBA8826572.1 pantoate--beta-alanine ligase [Halosaccharopolyspora lacisalsi]